MARRQYGAGSIRKVGNCWEVRVSLGVQADGKPLRIRKTAETKAEAEKIREHLVAERKLCVDEPIAKVFLEGWLVNKRLELKPMSFDRLECTVACHILPAVGSRHLSQLTSDDIQKVLADLVNKGYSHSTVKKVYHTFSQCYSYALAKNVMFNSNNPMPGVILPQQKSGVLPPKKEIYPFTIDECKLFVQEATRVHANGAPVYRLGWLFVLDLATGLRLGELLALKYSDFDLTKNILYVRRNIVRVKNRDPRNTQNRYISVIQQTLKTKKSHREIGINASIIDCVENLATITGEYEYIATTKNGEFVTPRNMARTFNNILDQCRIPRRGIHSLRHTFATRLFEEDVEVKIISELLGHSSVQTTYDMYIYIIKENLKDVTMAKDFLKPMLQADSGQLLQ